MHSKKILWIVTFLMLSISAHAFVLDPVFDALDLADLPGFYDRTASFIDLLLIVIFFGLLSKDILSKTTNARIGTKPAAIFGIILGLACWWWFHGIADMKLGDLGPIAMGLFMVILSIICYYFIRDMLGLEGHSAFSAWFTFVIFFPIIWATIPKFIEFFSESSSNFVRTIWGFTLLLWVVGLFFVIKHLFGTLGSIGGKTTSPTTPTTAPATPTPKASPALIKNVNDLDVMVNRHYYQVFNALTQYLHNPANMTKSKKDKARDIKNILLTYRLNQINTTINTLLHQIMTDPTLKDYTDHARIITLSNTYGNTKLNINKVMNKILK